MFPIKMAIPGGKPIRHVECWQCHKPPIWIDGFFRTHKNCKFGDGGSYCFTNITWLSRQPFAPSHHPPGPNASCIQFQSSILHRSPEWGYNGPICWIPGLVNVSKNYGKSPLLIGKSTISMDHFNSYVNVYQRVFTMFDDHVRYIRFKIVIVV